MINADAYQELMDALQKILEGVSVDKPKEEAPKKKGHSLTIVSISKAKPEKGGAKIPKSMKQEPEDEAK